MESTVVKLLHVEHRCKACETLKELYFTILNHTRDVVPYAQGVLCTRDFKGTYKVIAVSDISVVDSTSPYIQWMEKVIENFVKKKRANDIFIVDVKQDLDEENAKVLHTFSPENILFIPLKTVKEEYESDYVMVLFKEKKWLENEVSLLKHLAFSYAYFLFAMRSCGLKHLFKKLSFKKRYAYVLGAVLIVLMVLPVRLSVLAPLEVEAKNPYVVTSPLNGVLEEVNAFPNEPVEQNQLIVKFDDVDFKNNYVVAKRTLDVAKAELFSMKQGSFFDPKQKSHIAQLENQVKLKEAELAYVQEQLNKTTLYAQEEGIAIISNPNDWKGRPVSTGERIFLIAKPKEIEIKIMLPVSDAIFIEENAKVKVFFDNDPLRSWQATLRYVSYKPELTEQNILSYKMTAEFDDITENGYTPSIGLRGTAKIYSHNVTLFFYLFRKPITALRQWTGW